MLKLSGVVAVACAGLMVAGSLAQTPVSVRGVIVSVDAKQMVLKTDAGSQTIKLKQPYKVYGRVASDLAHVKNTSFIGVTTVKGTHGTERATEIHIFPEEMRGSGEGSRMMTAATGATPGSRMTNGAVAMDAAGASRMTNGSSSTISNGRMVVQYAGGTQSVVVPRDVKVTEIKLAPHKLAAGESAFVTLVKAADGSMTSDRAMLIH